MTLFQDGSRYFPDDRVRITDLRVVNYRSLGDDVRLSLGDLTALVGPNGAGKSNVADVFRFISEALRLGLEAAITKRRGIAALRRRSRGHPYDVTISTSVRGPSWSGSYELVIGGDRINEYRVKREHAEISGGLDADVLTVERGDLKTAPNGLNVKPEPLNLALPLVAGDKRFRPLYEALRGMAVYSIFPDTLREPQAPDLTKPMNEHGANWCSILKELPRLEWADDLRAGLAKVTGDIVDLKVKQVGGYLTVEFRHVGEGDETESRRQWFDAAQESDGTLRVAGILTALLQKPPITLIGIEEPELTIHPGALPLLLDHLREAATRSQVLITTHSPDLLDLLDVDEIRVVERRGGVTSVSPVDATQRRVVHDQLMSPGELLRSEGLASDRDGTSAA